MVVRIMKVNEAAFVSTTSVAAELFVVAKVARAMSISVKNAKAIANRAGAKARGFSPITDFIDEMSIETMKLVNLINHDSIELSRVAINELRIRDAVLKFQKVKEIASDAKYISTLSDSISRLRKLQNEERTKLFSYARKLKDLMDDISQRMSVASVIVSNSRIEAVNAEEYRSNLESIANDIENACQTIRDRVNSSEQRLESAIQQWKGCTVNESY